ncbi:MAG: MDR family oxidoreductase [Rhodospirillales bacterium]
MAGQGTSEGTFTALVLNDVDGKITPSVETLDNERLPEGDVTVAVKYSTLNYKDGMIVNGLGNLVRAYPHVPGIDFSGVVEASSSSAYKPGDKVILTGWRVGEARWGGYATRARVMADWLVPLPENLSLRDAMSLGTAGFTAMLAVMALEAHGLDPDDGTGGTGGDVLVTGAAGGVGSVAVALLAALGYPVAASTGRPAAHEYLRSLGAHTVVERAELETPPDGPLGKTRWAGAIDNVGGTTLATVLATLNRRASCAAVGLAAGPKLNTTVIPFLLRGINLLGIDSVLSPKRERLIAWQRLADTLAPDTIAAMTVEAGLADIPALSGKILGGEVRGRTVIDLAR